MVLISNSQFVLRIVHSVIHTQVEFLLHESTKHASTEKKIFLRQNKAVTWHENLLYVSPYSFVDSLNFRNEKNTFGNIYNIRRLLQSMRTETKTKDLTNRKKCYSKHVPRCTKKKFSTCLRYEVRHRRNPQSKLTRATIY